MNGEELSRTLHVHSLIARAYKDDRFPPPTGSVDVRQFVVTALWVVGIETVKETEEWYARMCSLLPGGSNGFWGAIREDAPRWRPEGERRWGGPCLAPMIRRDACGKIGRREVCVTDPADGTWERRYYCRKHADVANQVVAAQKVLHASGTLPEPVPNAGGLLPSYLASDWPEHYRRARPGWKPPTVGVFADDWPASTKAVVAQPMKLTAITGDGQEEEWGGEAPTLKVIKGGLHG